MTARPPMVILSFRDLRTDVDFTKTMGVKILQGRDFNNTPGDSSVMLLNKAAVEAMHLEKPCRYGNALR
jgi:putative ABC transport system permease protein